MSFTILDYHPPGSAEWLAQRRLGVGSSDAPVLCLGEHFGRTAISLWLEKVHGHAQEENLEMTMGKRMEAVIADMIAAREDWELQTVPTIRSDIEPWRLANLDRVVPSRGNVPLEIKNVRSGKGWGPNGSDEIPLPVYFQVQHQMDVYESPSCFVAALIAGIDLRLYEIGANPRLQQKIEERERAFWACVESRVPPDVTGDDNELLDQFFPPEPGSEREATIGEATLASEYAKACRATRDAGRSQRAADKVKKRLAAELKAAMQCRRLIIPGGGMVDQIAAAGKRAGKFDLKLIGIDLEDEDDDEE